MTDGRRIPVLLYHSIADTATRSFQRWAVDPALFDAHMAHLRRNGYHALTVTELTSAITFGLPMPEKAVAITFDDGFADFYEAALPTLQRHGHSATLYVSTAYLDTSARWLKQQGEGGRPMLTAEQLLSVADHDVEIGAHSHAHLRLDELPLKKARAQIVRSKQELEALGLEPRSFAYPYGYYGPGVRSLAIEAGFLSACGVRHAMSSRRDDLFARARIIVSNTTTVEQLESYLQGFDLGTAPMEEHLKTRLWRHARRTAGVVTSSLHDDGLRATV